MKTLSLFLTGLVIAQVSGCVSSRGPVSSESFETYFERVRSSGNETVLRQILTAFPKGGELHSHLSGAVPPMALLSIAADHEYQAVFDRSPRSFRAFELSTRKSKYAEECEDDAVGRNAWLECLPVSTLSVRDRELVRSALTLDGADIETDEVGRFREFTRIFQRLDELTDNTDVMPDLLKAVMQEASDHNISYLELKLNPFGRTDSDSVVQYVEDVITSLTSEATVQNQLLATRGRPIVEVRFVATTTRWSTVRLGGPARDSKIECNPTCPTRIEQLYYASTGSLSPAIVGMDLVGLPEAGIAVRKPYKNFKEDVENLRSRFGDGKMTLHAGETFDPQNDGHIAEAVGIRVKRLGHAFALARIATALAAVCGTDLTIEVSLASNLLLGFPKSSDLTEHPMPKYLRGTACPDGSKLRVTLNTDDAGIFGNTMSSEFVDATRAFDLSWTEVKLLAETSLLAAFVDSTTRNRLLTEWKESVSRFEKHWVRPKS